MLRVISQRSVARLAKIHEMTFSTLARGKLNDARVMRGKKSIGIDADHPAFTEWLAKYGVFDIDDKHCRLIENEEEAKERLKKTKLKDKNKAAKKKKKTIPEKVAAIKIESVAEPGQTEGQRRYNKEKQTHVGGYPIAELANITLQELVMRYGSIDGFKRCVDSLNSIAEYNFRQVKIEERRGILISRTLVSSVIFQVIDTAFQRLVTDIPANITQQVIGCVKSDGDNIPADIEKIYRDANSSVLKNIKVAILKTGLMKEGEI